MRRGIFFEATQHCYGHTKRGLLRAGELQDRSYD
jgi:hypothetical protein